MSVPFSNTKLRVPKGFQNILEGLAREVLRNQPDDIFHFGSSYFEQLMRVRKETGRDPAVDGSKLDDRFYNNDSFKSPGVDPTDTTQQDAALAIQTKYRQHAAQQEVESLKEEDAAVKIQAGFRGYQDRQKALEIKDPDAFEKQKKELEERVSQGEGEIDIDLTDPDVEKAAVKIQASFKGFKARKDVQEEKEEGAAEPVTEPAIEKATVVPLGEVDKGESRDDEEAEKAAIKIQAGYRGYQTRKNMKTSHSVIAEPSEQSKPREEEIDIDLQDPEVEKAATKIQAGFKGYKVRKEMSSKSVEANDEVKVGSPEPPAGEVTADEADKGKGDDCKSPAEDEPTSVNLPTEQNLEDSKEPEVDANVKQLRHQESVDIIQIPPDEAEKIIEVLSAFPSFRRPETLPDRLRLNRRLTNRVTEWYEDAKSHLENPTFTSMTSLIARGPQLFQQFGGEPWKPPAHRISDTVLEQDTSQDPVPDMDSQQVSLLDEIPEMRLTSDTESELSDDEEIPEKIVELVELQVLQRTILEAAKAMVSMTELSKEQIYKPYRAATTRYEQWLEENRDGLEPEDLARRTKQLKAHQKICQLYELEKATDSQEMKNAREVHVMTYIQKVMKYGTLPPEVQQAANEAFVPPNNDLPKLIDEMILALGPVMERVFGRRTSDSDSCNIS